ncbi:MAG: hypothetical protein ACLUJG_05655 [Lawsonibacter sp.]
MDGALLAMMVAVELVLVATGIGLIPLPVIKATIPAHPSDPGRRAAGPAGRRDSGGGVWPELYVDQHHSPGAAGFCLLPPL